jgi:tetratricopeptide (TPR) repeat protein
MKLGEYLFDKDRFQEALEVYGFLSRNTTPNMQLLQKQAYCCQQLGRYEQALELYLQAQLFQHDQVWNLKKIALCYHYLKNPEKALEYYLEAEKVQPDNLHTMVSIGHCLLELKNYEEALKYYFKVEYLDPGNKKVGRPIVWCALSLGKFDQAEKYSQKILDENPTRHDYMNMGHIHWCRGDRQAALHYYKQSITFQGNSMEAFIESFNNDIELLKKHNVDEADIPIMLDQLRYHLE